MHSSVAPENHAAKARRNLKWLLNTGVCLSLAALAAAAVTAYIHGRLDEAGSAYTSFCNVNSSINCDRVLTSPFAEIAGFPVAWMAMMVYAATAGLLLTARSRIGMAARWPLRLAVATIFSALLFSVYMAGVSLVVLKTLCLMCTVLYLAAALLAVVAYRSTIAFEQSWPSLGPLLGRTTVLAVAFTGVAAIGLFAMVTWPSPSTMPSELVSLAEVKKTYPTFYQWYTELPVSKNTEVITGTGRHIIGASDAPVTIVEFSDFECGYCRLNHELLKALLQRRPGEVNVIYRHFPLDASCNESIPSSLHHRACRAAEAAECAAGQGRFEDMVDTLFANQKRLFDSNLFLLASRIGLDPDDFRTCMDSHRSLPDITTDCRQGGSLGITSTPTLFINGRRIKGTFDGPWGYDLAVIVETHLSHPLH